MTTNRKEYMHEYMKKRRITKAAAGLCTSCGRVRVKVRKTCAKCRREGKKRLDKHLSKRVSKMIVERAPQGLYVFLVYTIDHELLGALGAREDADRAAFAHLKEGGVCKMNFGKCAESVDELDEAFWSWYNTSGEVTIEMTKLQ